MEGLSRNTSTLRSRISALLNEAEHLEQALSFAIACGLIESITEDVTDMGCRRIIKFRDNPEAQERYLEMLRQQ